MKRRVSIAVIFTLFLIKGLFWVFATVKVFMFVFPKVKVQRVRDVYSDNFVLMADNLCEKKEPFLLIVVVSSPKNYYQGDIIQK